jgi:hypothetical protein
MGRLIRLGLLYGALGFAAGFVFGLLRELVLIPNFGERFGHQIEFPLVTASVAIIGSWMARRFGGSESAAWLLGLGVAGTATLLAVESTFALAILRQPLETYLRSYDPTTGSLFPLGLAIMALAPLFSRAMQRFEPNRDR